MKTLGDAIKVKPTPRINVSADSLRGFLDACSLSIYFIRSGVLNARDTEIANSPLYHECCSSLDAGGCLNLDGEDITHLVLAIKAGAPEMFRAYLRQKYALENVYDYEKYERLLSRQKLRSATRKALSAETILKVFRGDNFRCKMCGTSETLTVDHIIPRIEGGGDTLGNLQTLCQSCNSKKGAT